MKVLKTETITEGIAKRRAIERAMAFFNEDKKEYFVKLEISYFKAGELEKTKEIVTARREIISQYLKVECLQYWRAAGAKSLRLHMVEYKDIWDFLKANQPKEVKKTLGGFLSNIFKKTK